MAPPSKEYAQPSSPTRSDPTQATGGPSSDVSADVSAASSGGGVSPDGAHRLNAQMGNSFVASMVMRDAAGGGGVDTSAAMASAGRSSGHALGGATQGAMESSFGADFSGVQVHTDGAAAEASSALNANAFTTGSDVYFGSGQFNPGSEGGDHLIAHELAHVAQGAGGAASPAGGGPTISSPGDAAERAADSAADAHVAGQQVGDVGGAPTSALSRDATSDLTETSTGDYFGDVDTAAAIQQLRAMPPAERNALVTDSSNHPTMERLARAFTPTELINVYTLVVMDLRWRFYFLVKGGHMEALSQGNWRWLIGFATPQEMDTLRDYATGFRAFLQNAPRDLVPAWDILQAMEDGSIPKDAQALRDAVNQLNVDQQVTVRADDAKMRMIAANSGDAGQAFRTIAYLDTPVKWAVFYLNTAGLVGELTDQQWGQMLAEGSKAEFDELVGWVSMWELTQANCPASILQVVRQNDSEDGSIDATLDDPVQMALLLSTLGAAGFMALCCQAGSDVVGNYGKIKTAGKVMDVLNGLNVGAKLGDRTSAGLRTWFFDAGETDITTLEKMMTVRFKITVGGEGSKNHEITRDASGNIVNNPNRNIEPWTLNGLRLAWGVIEALPPTAVEQNPNFMHMVRNNAASNGNAYYSNDFADPNGVRSTGDVVMGYRDSQDDGVGTDIDSQMASASNLVYNADGQEAGSAAVDVLKFNATLRHEIGHAVDDQMGLMDGWRGVDAAGGWTKYDSYTQFVDGIISAGTGFGTATNPLHTYPGQDVAFYRQAMINAVTSGQTFSAAVEALNTGAGARAVDAGPVAAVWDPTRWSKAGNPWYNPGNWKTQGDRNFHRAYSNSTSLYSFSASTRTSRMVTKYQWRAPGEWFAEAYQVYYAEQEQGPNVPVGGILRAKDPQAANMISNFCDRGHSPQDMRGSGSAATGMALGGGTGAGTVRAPGT